MINSSHSQQQTFKFTDDELTLKFQLNLNINNLDRFSNMLEVAKKEVDMVSGVIKDSHPTPVGKGVVKARRER